MWKPEGSMGRPIIFFSGREANAPHRTRNLHLCHPFSAPWLVGGGQVRLGRERTEVPARLWLKAKCFFRVSSLIPPKHANSRKGQRRGAQLRRFPFYSWLCPWFSFPTITEALRRLQGSALGPQLKGWSWPPDSLVYFLVLLLLVVVLEQTSLRVGPLATWARGKVGNW